MIMRFFMLFSYPKICDNSKNLLNKKEIRDVLTTITNRRTINEE